LSMFYWDLFLIHMKKVMLCLADSNAFFHKCSYTILQPRNTKYLSLGDGRSLCMECLGSAVTDTGECQPLYHSIRDYYEGMYMKLDQQIPMLLVERQALNEAMEGESKVSSISAFLRHTTSEVFNDHCIRIFFRVLTICLKQEACVCRRSRL
jgi:hypothetical protein